MDLNNGIPLINGIAYGWADVHVLIAGVPVTGIKAIEYADDQDVVNIQGAGRHPVARGKGRITSTGKITLLQEEVLAIQAKAPNHRIQDIAPFNVQVSYLPEDGHITHDVIKDCQFKKNERKWAEGDTSQFVELELVVGSIKWGA